MLLLELASNNDDDGQPTVEANQLPLLPLGEGDLVEQDSKSIEGATDSKTEGGTSDNDELELEDLDQLEDYLYGKSSDGADNQLEMAEELQSWFGDEEYLDSVDIIMRPLQKILAPDLDYRPVDEQLSKLNKGGGAINDTKDILRALFDVLGQFAIRQDNLQLLKRVYGEAQYCS